MADRLTEYITEDYGFTYAAVKEKYADNYLPVIARLAAYEDIGTPEQLAAQQKRIAELEGLWKTAINQMRGKCAYCKHLLNIEMSLDGSQPDKCPRSPRWFEMHVVNHPVFPDPRAIYFNDYPCPDWEWRGLDEQKGEGEG